MSANTTTFDLKQWTENQEYGKIASFFTSLTGSSEGTKALLERVVATLPNSNSSDYSRKRPAPSPASSHVISTPSQHHSFLLHDSLDEMVITSLVQIPNDKAVIGAIIGPQGKNIRQMTDSTGCVVNLDQKSESAKSRTAPITVFLQGTLQSVVNVAELLAIKVETVVAESSGNSNWASTGSGANRTAMLIPDSLVKRVIGRGGSTVTKLQQDSGAAIQLQSEAKMMAAPDPLFGREALLTGPLEARLHGMYLICRMLLDDKECPPAWRTPQQFPTPMRGPSSGGGGGVMTAKGVFPQGPPAPLPLPRGPTQQLQQHQQGLGMGMGMGMGLGQAYLPPQQQQQQQHYMQFGQAPGQAPRGQPLQPPIQPPRPSAGAGAGVAGQMMGRPQQSAQQPAQNPFLLQSFQHNKR